MTTWRATLGYCLDRPMSAEQQMRLTNVLAPTGATLTIDGNELSTTMVLSSALIDSLDSASRVARYRALHALHSAGLTVTAETSMTITAEREGTGPVSLTA